MNSSDETPMLRWAKLSRIELYQKVWATPRTQLAKEFGISDVAIAKRCKKLNIPQPPLGYWAKFQAGKKLKRAPLPPTEEEVFEQEAKKKPKMRKLALLEEACREPLIAEFMAALKKSKNKWEQRIRLREVALPETTVSPALIERSVQAFHFILVETESVGIPFRKSRSSYDGGIFRIGHDQLYFEMEEEMVNATDRTSAPKRQHIYSTYDNHLAPSGKLSFKIKDNRYGAQTQKSWSEGKDGKLEDVLIQVITGIRHYFIDVKHKRAQEAIDRERHRLEQEERQREYLRYQVRREDRDERDEHAKALRKIIRERREDLFKAAEWWRMHQVLESYIADCQQKWMAAQDGQLNPEQTRWIAWAKATSVELSPAARGYPDAVLDGPLALQEIPIGGPYPDIRNFPQPPSMPKIPEAKKEVRSQYGRYY
jgi:hypothetical protein